MSENQNELGYSPEEWHRLMSEEYGCGPAGMTKADVERSRAIHADFKAAEKRASVPLDATPAMVKAALAVDWSNENEEATVHNVWHAMVAAYSPPNLPTREEETRKSASEQDKRIAAGKVAYDRHTDNHPTIHSNRFPAWEELSAAERLKWIEG